MPKTAFVPAQVIRWVWVGGDRKGLNEQFKSAVIPREILLMQNQDGFPLSRE